MITTNCHSPHLFFSRRQIHFVSLPHLFFEISSFRLCYVGRESRIYLSPSLSRFSKRQPIFLILSRMKLRMIFWGKSYHQKGTS